MHEQAGVRDHSEPSTHSPHPRALVYPVARRGDEVLDARIEIEGRPETLWPGRIVPNAPFRARAVDGPSHSAWVRLGPADAGPRSTWISPRSSEDGPGAQP